MAKWCRVVSNVFFLAAFACAATGIVALTGWFDRPARLTVADQLIDLGEVSPGSVVPLAFTLHNDSRAPIRLVGAAEE
jgi:hypothetical protein